MLYVLRPIIIKLKISATAIAIQKICHIAEEYISAGNREESPISREMTTAEINIMISVRRIFRIISLFNCHTFSFDQPTRTADGSKDYHFRHSRISLFHHLANESIIGNVAEVDRHMSYVFPSAISLLQKHTDILKHPYSLGLDIPGSYDLPFVVDAGSPGYIYVSTIGIVYSSGALECHSIFRCRFDV